MKRISADKFHHRRLSTLAKLINGSGQKFHAEVVEGFCNTDRKVGRLRIPGKGRAGNRLIVRDSNGNTVLDHNAAETYRTNSEVVDWMIKNRVIDPQ